MRLAFAILLVSLTASCGNFQEAESFLEAIQPAGNGDIASVPRDDRVLIAEFPDFKSLVQLMPTEPDKLRAVVAMLDVELVARGAPVMKGLSSEEDSGMATHSKKMSSHQTPLEEEMPSTMARIRAETSIGGETMAHTLLLMKRELGAMFSSSSRERQRLTFLSIEERMQRLSNTLYVDLVAENPFSEQDRRTFSQLRARLAEGQPDELWLRLYYDGVPMKKEISELVNQLTLAVCLEDERTCKAFIDQLALSGALQRGLTGAHYGRWRHHVVAAADSLVRHYLMQVTNYFFPQAQVTFTTELGHSEGGDKLYRREGESWVQKN